MSVKVIKEEDLKLHDSLYVFESEKVAYLRKSTKNSLPIWVISSAMGEPLGYAAERDIAKEIARQNDLMTVSLH